MDCLVDEGLPTLVFALSLTLHGFPIAGSKLKITPLPLNAIGDPYGLAILCTGLDAVDSSIANGANSSDTLRRTTTMPTVLVGGQPVNVVFSGLSPQFVGVNQINITLPTGTPAGSAVPLQIVVEGSGRQVYFLTAR
jgi:uncharacterized protein (TIGR03437 family)